MKSLRAILREEINYWLDVTKKTSNPLLLRTANLNILKRRSQISKLNKNIIV